MLPPVTATIGSDITFSNLPAQQLAGAQAAVASKQAINDGSQTPALLFAKANLASLSSQLQVAQNVTVLADAIGKLMNMPKLDGEAARNYVVRLVTALQEMPAAQRSALEVQIAKILPGLTLSILTETLKNPTGPQAARLAMLLETAVSKDSDLAAKAVVSSYRQNIGADARAQTPQAQHPNSLTQPAAASASSPATTAKAAQVATPVPTAPSPQNSASASTSALPSAATPSQQAASPGAKPLTATSSQSNLTANQAAVAKDLAPNPAAKTELQSTSAASAGPIRHSPLAAPTQNLPAASPKAASTTAEPMPAGASVKADAKAAVQLPVANARPLELRSRLEPLHRAAPAAANDAALAPKDSASIAKEATAIVPNPVAALINAISTARLPSAADANQSIFASLIGMVKSSIKDLSFTQPAGNSSHNGEIDAELEQLKGLAKNEIQARLLEAIRHLPPDHPQVQALLMSAVRNELAPALPYVNYPAADDDYEGESYPRGQWSSSSGEEPSDEQAEGDTDDDPREIAALEDNELQALDFVLDDDDPIERHAENYYLRMGNLL